MVSFLSSLGSSLYLGFHENIDESKFKDIEKLNLENMSQNGLLKLNTKAVEKKYIGRFYLYEKNSSNSSARFFILSWIFS